MTTATVFSMTRCLFSNLTRTRILPAASNPNSVAPAYTNPVTCMTMNRLYSDGEWKGKGKDKGALKEEHRGKAWCDMPPDVDPKCPVLREKRQHVKKGIIHKIKLKILEGGSNFGTPFRMLTGKLKVKEGPEEEERGHEPKLLPAPKREEVTEPEVRPGVTVTILGADTAIGQYVALLLKQSSCFRKLRLYEAQDTSTSPCSRDLCQVVTDLQHIDTNCAVEGYSCANCDLERCLQNSDIVLMLESACVSADMSAEKRFMYQAPIVKQYTDAIAGQCPTAFIVCCTSPIDCMVPLIAETMREMNWYDHRKLLGSMAVPEMRASTIAARALSLEPRYTRVPCVGGTEGEALVPLFSRAIDYFEFPPHCVEWLTEAVRASQSAVYHEDTDGCKRAADLSEAHAVARLVINVAHALLCHDITKVTGFVEADPSQVIACSRFIGMPVDIGGSGIIRTLGLPKMNEIEKELMDKLLNKLEENEPELATSPEEECVICVNAKATMQTSPCGHRVVCRRCFVKTIQMAVSQRLLPLRCVICRAKILRLRQAPRLVTSKSWQVSSGSGKSWCVPGSVSSYSVGARSVPASASLYSVTSGESSLSGVSSVSSNSGGATSGSCSTKLCGGASCGGACLGAVPRAPSSANPRPRQPASHSLRRSQHHSMKARLQEYQQVHSYTGAASGAAGEPSGRLPPIREFQREFREGRRESACATAAASASTRIRCAQKIVTQLETSPQKKSQHFFRPLKPPNKDDRSQSRDPSKETERKKENPKAKANKDEKKSDDSKKQEEKNKKDESNENKKNEAAERKKEEKLRLKAEKEAKKEAKQQAKEEERQAKLLAKEEEKQAKLLAKEEKKKAKKEAKLAAQAEKEKGK